MTPNCHPILSCKEAGAFEGQYFKGDPQAEWAAMRQAGSAVACAILEDFCELGAFPEEGKLLVLCGKGHNGGDALIAAGEILARFPRARAEVAFAFGSRKLKPLTTRAFRELVDQASDRVLVIEPLAAGGVYDVSIDGVFGFSFHPPLDKPSARFLKWANDLTVRLRAAVDLPSGLDLRDAFRADFSYATGIAKTPLLAGSNAGRLRYLDLGFFDGNGGEAPESDSCVLLPSVLDSLSALRPSHTDKRERGHLLVVGGSLAYPGAILMTVLSALRSGVGLVTAFVPEVLVPAFAARAPEAMWVGCPKGSGLDGLTPEAFELIAKRWGKAKALVLGPGMGREGATHELIGRIVRDAPVPLVVDADALQPDIVRSVKVPHILTPHMGEFARIAGGAHLRKFCRETAATVVLKGPVTCIASAAAPLHYSFFGGPVLARGGSGDILAGLVGGLLAQMPGDPMQAACMGAVWHGRAADCLARAKGQTSVSVTQLIDFLPGVLRQ